MTRSLFSLSVLLLLLSCGSTSDGASSSGGSPPSTPPGSSTDATNPARPVDHGASIWDVKGTDERGAFEGHVELAATNELTRVVRYPGSKVEGDRELWWVWHGQAARAPDGTVGTRVDLSRMNFVVERDGFTRPDPSPVAVHGRFTPSPTGFEGSYQELATNETWTASTATSPIFVVDRKIVPSHDPPDPTVKATLFATFASYHALPAVKPYVGNADFQAAQHGFVADKTDFDFYRQNQSAIRVVDQVIDPISLLESLVRANAYRSTFSDKAKYFDTEIRQFVDTTGFVGTSFDVVGNHINPSGDGALWAGVYVATQAYRFWTTGEAVAKENARQTWKAMLRLQPITGDNTTFARVLRPAGSGPLGDGWHAGTGAFADVEWKEGGNNDMLKGMFVGYAIGWKLFCTGASPDPSCPLAQQNARDLADHVAVAQDKTNKLKSQWLAAIVTGGLNYRVGATASWVELSTIIAQGTLATFEYGVADWSGTHLGFWDYETMFILAGALDLGNVVPTLQQGADVAAKTYERARLALWDLTRNAHGTKDAASLADGKLRMAEVPCPKPTGGRVDHSKNAAWVISPYPALFWKNDWTTTDRTQALRGVPMFEGPGWTSTAWKSNMMSYDDDSRNVRYHGIDFLSAYWYGRYYGIITASE